jgi:RNA polymerase sigma factor (sigma-70 family)
MRRTHHSAQRASGRRPTGCARTRSAERDAELCRRARLGDADARRDLVNRHLGLVAGVAYRYRDLGLPLDDLRQEGAIGLLEAIDCYDPTRSTSFSTYACWRIRRAIMRALTDQGRLVHLPKQIVERRRAFGNAAGAAAQSGKSSIDQLCARTGLSAASVTKALSAPSSVASLDEGTDDGISLGETTADPAAPDPERQVIASATHDALSEAVARLPARQRTVVTRHFGLDGDPQSLAEVAAALELSPQRTRAIEQDALEELATRLAGRV